MSTNKILILLGLAAALGLWVFWGYDPYKNTGPEHVAWVNAATVDGDRVTVTELNPVLNRPEEVFLVESGKVFIGLPSQTESASVRVEGTTKEVQISPNGNGIIPADAFPQGTKAFLLHVALQRGNVKEYSCVAADPNNFSLGGDCSLALSIEGDV